MPKKGDRKITTENLIERFKTVHGDTYDYSKVVYTRWEDKVEISCKEHGSFFQIYSSHLKGDGCPTCRYTKTSFALQDTLDDFLHKSKRHHGDRYSYDKVVYSGCNNPVVIGCQIRGDFEQKPIMHTTGHGCLKCAREYRAKGLMLTTGQYIQKCIDVHGGKYDYSKTEYKGSSGYVVITCKQHGDFEQQPRSHLRGSGCRACIPYGFKNNKPATLYVLHHENLVKVGITARALKFRLREISSETGLPFAVAFQHSFENGRQCSDVETSILRKLKEKFANLEEGHNGYSETFSNAPLSTVVELCKLEVEKNE